MVQDQVVAFRRAGLRGPAKSGRAWIHRCALGIVLMGSPGLAQTSPAPGLTTPREAADVFVAATAAGDAERIAALYAPGAVLLVPGLEPLNGRAAIAHINKRNFEIGPNKLIFSLVRAETAGADRAAVYWEWEREIAPKAGGAARKSSGRSLVYFRKYPEGWLISADMMQARPTAPAAARPPAPVAPGATPAPPVITPPQ